MILEIYLGVSSFFGLAGAIDYARKQRKFDLKWTVAFGFAFIFIWPYALFKWVFSKKE